MSNGWIRSTFGQQITLQRGYDLPETQWEAGNVPVVTSVGIAGYHSIAKVRGPGVVTGRSGTLGRVHYIAPDFWPHNTALFVKDFHGNDPRYVYYFLQTLDTASFNAGSGVPTLNRNHLANLPVYIPALPIQRRIADILGALDDKIECNRRINQTLEAMAQALYKHWFVDFGPFRDGGMVQSELGEIPQGWEVQPLGTQIEIAKGLSYKGSGLSQSGTPMHNLDSVLEGGGYKYKGIKFYSGQYQDRHMALVHKRGMSV